MFRRLLRFFGIPSRPTPWDRKDRTTYTYKPNPDERDSLGFWRRVWRR